METTKEDTPVHERESWGGEYNSDNSFANYSFCEKLSDKWLADNECEADVIEPKCDFFQNTQGEKLFVRKYARRNFIDRSMVTVTSLE